MVVNQEFLFDLDTGRFVNGIASLPVGYSHNLRIKFVKNGVQGHELPFGSALELIFDDKFPVSQVDPIHRIPNSSFVWNPSLEVYETGFNAEVRPLNLISTSTFATRLEVSTDQNRTFKFHTKFRNTQLPGGIDPCDNFDDQIPKAILNFFRLNFKYGLLPDKPEFNDLNKPDLQTVIDLFDESERLNYFGFLSAEEDVAANSFAVDVTPPSGVDPEAACAFSVLKLSGNEQILPSGTHEVVAGKTRVYLNSAPSAAGTHKLVVCYGKR